MADESSRHGGAQVWLIPLFVAIIAFHGWSTMVDYVGNVNVADAIFVVVIMTMASSLPIIRFTETVIARVSAIGKGTPASWWLAILTLGPLLGSFITGPAAMTICALLLRHRFYSLKPSERLKYATLGPAVRQHLPRRGIDPVCISAGCDRREHLEMGPGVHANPFRLESCHRDHLVQFAVPYVVSERIAGLESNVPDEEQDQEVRRPIPWHPFPLSLLDSSERPLSGARDLGSSFLSRLRLSYAAKPARDRVAVAVTRRVLPSSTNHRRSLL